MMSKLSDQIVTINEFGDTETRYLSFLLDGLAWANNLSLSAIFVDEDEEGEKPKLTRLASSYESPFLAMCRDSEKFRSIEDAALVENSRHLIDEKRACQVFRGPGPLKSLFSVAICETPIERVFLVAGPVLVRCTNGVERFEEKNERQALFDQLADVDERFFNCEEMPNSEPSFSKTRAERLIFNRAPILIDDLTTRFDNIRLSFGAICKSKVDLTEPSADAFEALGKVVSFSVRQLSKSETGRVDQIQLSGNEFSKRFVQDKQTVLCLSFDQKKLELTQLTSQQNSRPYWEHNSGKTWSRFCDEYRTCRNAYFLEKLLVVRLWLQDRFAGTTISSYDGLERTDDFCEFAKKVGSLCSADGCVIYRFHPGETSNGDKTARLGYLQPLGSSYDSDFLQEREEVEAEHLASIAEDTDRRSKSACYRCVDTGMTVFLSDAETDEISSAQIHPKSVLVVPLITRGRIWGAIEILGKQPRQIPKNSPRWISEVARISTPIFYNQWVLFHFREMSKVAVSREETDQKYMTVIDHVRQLFLASSARLFIQNSSRTSRFETVAHAGVAFPELAAQSFDLEDENSVSAQSIEQNLPWRSGRIGTGDFEEHGYPGGGGPLELDGHKAAMVFPIMSQGGNCFASVIVTSVDDEEFPDDWLTIVGTLSLQLSVILEAIHLQDLEVAEQQAYFAHTIKTRTDRVLSGGERILEMMSPLFGSKEMYDLVPSFINSVELAFSRQAKSMLANESENREVIRALKKCFPVAEGRRRFFSTSLPRAIEDLSEHLSELRISAISIAGGPNAELPFETRPEVWGGTPCRLRFVLSESLKPLGNNTRYRRHLELPPIAALHTSVSVRIPEPVLLEIINNLFDNAMKYDFSPPSLTYRVRSSHNDTRYVLEIRNLAPVLSREEAREVAQGGVRANYASDKDPNGTGLGLKFAIEMAELWGLGLTYEVPTESRTGDENALGWHILRLTMENVRDKI